MGTKLVLFDRLVTSEDVGRKNFVILVVSCWITALGWILCRLKTRADSDLFLTDLGGPRFGPKIQLVGPNQVSMGSKSDPGVGFGGGSGPEG